MAFNQESIDHLAQRCQEETTNFNRFLPHNPEPCFELLRLGLMLENHYAFEKIYTIYQPQVVRWMKRHNSYSLFEDEQWALVNASFARLYQYLHNGRFPHKAESVAGVMQFLKKCVWSIIREYLRKLPPVVPFDDDLLVDQQLDFNLHETAIWQRIHELLPENRQRLLVHCAFVLGMKPGQIYEQYNQLWPNSHAVSAQLHRVRIILRNDDILRGLLS